MAGKLFIISAPSGAGKTTLVEAVLGRLGWCYPLKKVITYTCKEPRPNEKQGEDYHFICKKEFKAKMEQGFFIEWSEAYGCYYGSPRSIIDGVEHGFSYMLVIDRVGAEKIREKYKEAILIWIYTKNLEVLRERLEHRNTESSEQIECRLVCARREIAQELEVPIYNYHILNDDFERSLRKLEKILRRELGDQIAL